ncbi:MAG TPA: alpha/beta fold hydrolase [Actinomycetes bacterium]|jgi:pimeloyl-ACP methyl ester carboxylesterase
MWLPVVGELVATHRVVAPDLPGLGASRVPGGPPNAAGVLAWLDALVQRTGAAPPALVGASLGASIAARYAIEDAGHFSIEQPEAFRAALRAALGQQPE